MPAASDFEGFWASYPRKVGKLDAMKAYRKALTVSSADEILAGVQNYRQHLPDDVRFIPYASSWLNAGRWMDEYEAVVRDVKPREDRSTCVHEPTCISNDWHRAMLMRDRERGAA